MSETQNETNTMTDLTAVFDQLKKLNQKFEQIPTLIADEISKQDLVTRADLAKSIEPFRPATEIQSLMAEGFENISNQIDTYARATTQKALAHEATINLHGKQLETLSAGHQSQQDQLSRIDAIMEIVTEGIPNIQEGIQEERLANGLLRQRVLTVEVKAEQNREKVQNLEAINESIKELNIDIKRNEVIMLRIEKRESDRETARAKKADERAEFITHAKKQMIKWLPWILFGGGGGSAGFAELLKFMGR